MQYTTFKNETVILKRGKEVLLETAHCNGGRQFVALARNQFNTDYPLRYDDGKLGWDNPEYFTPEFRAMVRMAINRVHDDKTI